MSTTTKGFNYIFNSSIEDHKITKLNSTYKPYATVSLQALSGFVARILKSNAEVQCFLFSTYYICQAVNRSVNKKMLDFRHFQIIEDLKPINPCRHERRACCFLDQLFAS